ncbi:uncharacterized protein LOC121261678 isoform X1 [Juglans microcarpa x Juglans regia]|uniref:uncharacterized protein LOC121261678 isoform X1 n=1 Tax=Juglans microcarpa x Juglans regia TaxID=2249226 RepID=UPI001B7E25D0|nr:uncharacterized protein LOC121261678 isoform X1 [Juglans microcarpa x Juglans regia]
MYSSGKRLACQKKEFTQVTATLLCWVGFFFPLKPMSNKHTRNFAFLFSSHFLGNRMGGKNENRLIRMVKYIQGDYLLVDSQGKQMPEQLQSFLPPAMQIAAFCLLLYPYGDGWLLGWT